LVSGEQKTRKPFPEIYKKLMDKFNLNPQSCLFIDDNLRNIKPANDMGIHTIHFQNAEILEKQLTEYGII
jgi:2-haloacid dehalogenase